EGEACVRACQKVIRDATARGRGVGQRVITRPQIELGAFDGGHRRAGSIGDGAARQRDFGSGITADTVVDDAQGIEPRTAIDRGAALAYRVDNDVVATLAIDDVIAGPSIQRVSAIAAIERIVAAETEEN